MPVLESSYRAPRGLRGGHFGTVFPTLFRRVPPLAYERERLEMLDGDFLDLDWTKSGSRRVVIIAHGLEGDSQAKYIRGMTHAMRRRGYDVLAWNCRGCSGEPNRLLRSYHSGISEDLKAVVDHVLTLDYEELALVGFSLGGNITLKYLGEQKGEIDARVKSAVTFSVPCDLTSSSLRLGEPQNRIYMHRFMEGLKEKVRIKSEQFPDEVDLSGLDEMKTFAQFDDRFTAVFNGFSSAKDYWKKASSKPFLSGIRVPTLLISAKNDPFLAPACFPYEIAEASAFFHLETPEQGGHVGFAGGAKEYWSETRAAEFIASD